MVARIGNHMLVNVSSAASNTVLGYVMMSENNRKKAEQIQKSASLLFALIQTLTLTNPNSNPTAHLNQFQS